MLTAKDVWVHVFDGVPRNNVAFHVECAIEDSGILPVIGPFDQKVGACVTRVICNALVADISVSGRLIDKGKKYYPAIAGRMTEYKFNFEHGILVVKGIRIEHIELTESGNINEAIPPIEWVEQE